MLECSDCGGKCLTKCRSCTKPICSNCLKRVMVKGISYSICPFCSEYDLKAKLKKSIRLIFNPELVS